MAEEPQSAANVALGRAIAARRSELGLKRRDLADRAELSYPYISELENGHKQPSPKALRRIAEALGLDGSELLGLGERLEDVVESAALETAPHAISETVLPTRMMAALPLNRPERDAGAPRTPPELVRSEIRRELDAWAAYRLPELIERELRRLAPQLFEGE